MRRASVVTVATLALVWSWGTIASAQNDWQFPDPYFGILEIEKSRPTGATPRMSGQPRWPKDIGGGVTVRQGTARRRWWRPAGASAAPVPQTGAGTPR